VTAGVLTPLPDPPPLFAWIFQTIAGDESRRMGDSSHYRLEARKATRFYRTTHHTSTIFELDG